MFVVPCHAFQVQAKPKPKLKSSPQCMPPRDLVGLSLLYDPDFYYSYCEFINRHSHILGVEVAMHEASETSDEEEDDDGFQREVLTDSSDSEEDSNSEGGGMMEVSDLEIAVLTGTGTIDDPYDLTLIIEPEVIPDGYIRATPEGSEVGDWGDELDQLRDLEHFHE